LFISLKTCARRAISFAFRRRMSIAGSFALLARELDVSFSRRPGGRYLFESHGNSMLDLLSIVIWRTPMMTKGPLCIQATNLSHAWAQAFLASAAPGGDEISPLTVTVTGFINNRPIETPSIKQALDQVLLAHRKRLCETVAGTI